MGTCTRKTLARARTRSLRPWRDLTPMTLGGGWPMRFSPRVDPAKRGTAGSDGGTKLTLLARGPPRDCIAHLLRYAACGCRRITFRLSTMGDPMAQLRRLTEEVLPFVCANWQGQRFGPVAQGQATKNGNAQRRNA